MKYLLDTNIVSYYLKGMYPSLIKRLTQIEAGDCTLSVVVAGELLHGIQRLAESQTKRTLQAKLNQFLQAMPVLSLNSEVAKHYAVIYAQLERQGLVIGGNDLWIAAHAKSQDLTLVTNNTREFARVDGLRVENWTEEC